MVAALGARVARAAAAALVGGPGIGEELRFAARHPVWRLVGPRAARYIACKGIAEEGAGSQAMMFISTINFARAAGLTYLHRPFQDIAHADRPAQDWAHAWETMFNFGYGELPWAAGIGDVLEYNPYEYSGWVGGLRANKHFDQCLLNLIPELRRRYRSNKPARARDSALTIAVHVRRGDVSPTLNNFLFSSLSPVFRTCESVREVLRRRGSAHRFCVVSQGVRDDFVELFPLEPQFMLDMDSLASFSQLVEADILIMAKGAFSYVAGMLSEGITLVEPHYRPLPRWIVRDSDGSFSMGDFERQLDLLQFGALKPEVRAPDAQWQ